MRNAANDPSSDDLEISEADLRAYVDGRLDPAGRRRVEGLLACSPDLAAQVMTQMHLARGGKRRTTHVAWAVALGIGVAASAVSGLAGWTLAGWRDLGGWRELDGESPPDYVEDAAESREATRLRESMVSQVETPQLDASEIRRTLKLTLPRLPAGWRVKDVQVFPTDDGPSVNVVVETASRRRLELFAVRANTPATDRPEIATRGNEAVAFWERGEAAYVLSGPQSHQELLADASELAGSANL